MIRVPHHTASLTSPRPSPHRVLTSPQQSQVVVDETKEAALHSFIARLRNMCVERLDAATCDILQYSDNYVEDGNNEVLLTSKAEKMKMALWVNLTKKTLKNKLLDFSKSLEVVLTLPKPLTTAYVAVRACHFPFGHTSRFGTDFDLLGGVFSIDIIHLPPKLKKVKGWVMRPIHKYGQEVVRDNYPIGSADGQIAAVAPPIKCQIELPNEEDRCLLG